MNDKKCLFKYIVNVIKINYVTLYILRICNAGNQILLLM